MGNRRQEYIDIILNNAIDRINSREFLETLTLGELKNIIDSQSEEFDFTCDFLDEDEDSESFNNDDFFLF